MFGLFTNMDAESAEDKEVLEAISKLKGLRILGKQDARNARELYKEAFTLIPIKEYEELMSVRDKDKDMKFYIKETTKGTISELLMVMAESCLLCELIWEIEPIRYQHRAKNGGRVWRTSKTLVTKEINHSKRSHKF